jgi:hypothetical protein
MAKSIKEILKADNYDLMVCDSLYKYFSIKSKSGNPKDLVRNELMKIGIGSMTRKQRNDLHKIVSVGNEGIDDRFVRWLIEIAPSNVTVRKR